MVKYGLLEGEDVVLDGDVFIRLGRKFNPVPKTAVNKAAKYFSRPVFRLLDSPKDKCIHTPDCMCSSCHPTDLD